MIFVDTGAWFASVVPTDADHAAARAWLAANRAPLVTTDYVIDETLTLLKMRGEIRRALALGEQFFKDRLATIHFLSEADIRYAWNIFTQFSDKQWSFTDCTSKAMIERLNLTDAFAFDHHFAQFGSITVHPLR
jgi:predicted nucleic acid-binding protein